MMVLKQLTEISQNIVLSFTLNLNEIVGRLYD